MTKILIYGGNERIGSIEIEECPAGLKEWQELKQDIEGSFVCEVSELVSVVSENNFTTFKNNEITKFVNGGPVA